jgi:hypothetical protein
VAHEDLAEDEGPVLDESEADQKRVGPRSSGEAGGFRVEED